MTTGYKEMIRELLKAKNTRPDGTLNVGKWSMDSMKYEMEMADANKFGGTIAQRTENYKKLAKRILEGDEWVIVKV